MYGCHNKPRPTTGTPIKVQDGYHAGMFSYESGASDRLPRMVSVPYVMSTTCQYDKSATDTSCKGCQWAKTE